jgi:membrane fusion protein (multidrug efflux system)
MFVRTRLIFESRDNALMIPEQALVADPVQAFVFTVVEGKAKKVLVKTGLRRDAKVEVLEGLRAGDVVVSAGQLKLRDGAPVRDAVAPPPGAPGAVPGAATATPSAPAEAKPEAKSDARPEAKPEPKAEAPAKAAS